jgi:peroxiredoxin
MPSSSETKEAARQQRLKREAEARSTARGRGLRNRVLVSVGGAIAVLAAIFLISSGGSSSGGGSYAFEVGSPGAGQPAPPIQLADTQGGQFNLAAQRGKTVLLYFQEALTCQPCWDQLKDLDRASPQLQAMGISELVSVTTDPLGNLRQKASDEGLTTPVLSDPNLTVSQSYGANRYGMMGSSRDGHTFIVVGPDGHIRWRADYGGAPNYTMYVPVAHLLADLRKGLSGAA